MTGGSGFIGSALARHFHDEGLHVETLDVAPQPKDLGRLGIHHRTCDLREYEALKACLEDAQIVLHTAILQIPTINKRRTRGFEVNVLGTENLCKGVESTGARGLILAGSWHVVGESDLSGTVTEGFGYRPDKVEDRARFYALSKIAQELVVRLHGEASEKVFGILRLGTVLGEGMPPETAASIFIDQALNGQSLTPYKHSMHRPMVYVSLRDVLTAFHRFSLMILSGEYTSGENSLGSIANVLHPEAVTILDLARMVSEATKKVTKGQIEPQIEVVDKGLPTPFDEEDKRRVRFDVRRSKDLLGLGEFIPPAEEIEAIIRGRVESGQ